MKLRNFDYVINSNITNMIFITIIYKSDQFFFTKVSFLIKINAYNNFDKRKPMHYVQCHI